MLNEYRLAISIDSSLVSASIDRLVLIYVAGKIVAAEIVDFKSEHVAASDVDSRAEAHRPQLDAYRDAVSLAFDLPADRIKQTVVFVQVDHVQTLAATAERNADQASVTVSPTDTGATRSQKTLW